MPKCEIIIARTLRPVRVCGNEGNFLYEVIKHANHRCSISESIAMDYIGIDIASLG